MVDSEKDNLETQFISRNHQSGESNGPNGVVLNPETSSNIIASKSIEKPNNHVIISYHKVITSNNEV